MEKFVLGFFLAFYSFSFSQISYLVNFSSNSPCNHNAIIEKNKNLIQLSPNPTSADFFIRQDKFEPFRFEIQSINGNIVLNEQILENNSKISIESLENGVYFSVLYFIDRKLTFKIVKQ